ncbi:MAG: hypothetical protein N3G20_02210 [Verrucomicrobiae bacterium]|nr:hypothetical protein [Verrucomicrobiae bacterium]
MKRQVTLTVFVCIGVLVLAVVVPWIVLDQAVAAKGRKQMLLLYEQVRPGDPIETVHGVVFSNNLSRVRLRVVSSNTIVVTPLLITRFGGEWVMNVGASNGIVTSVRVRLLDGEDCRPNGGPPDKEL